ncbi:MAG: phosphodiester glycosidase family protein [Pseudomonadota bacterium]
MRIIPVETQGVVTLIRSSVCSGYFATGGFTDEMSPNTLLEVNGERLSKLQKRAHNDGGVLVVEDESIQLLRYAERRKLRRMSGDKLQSHPILVMDNAVDKPLNDKRMGNRVAVGLLKDGRIILAMAHDEERQGTTATTTGQFAEKILEIIDDEISWLLNLDGGASAFLVTPNYMIAPSNGLVSSYICVE